MPQPDHNKTITLLNVAGVDEPIIIDTKGDSVVIAVIRENGLEVKGNANFNEVAIIGLTLLKTAHKHQN